MPIPISEDNAEILYVISGRTKLPGSIDALTGTWFVRIRTIGHAATDADGTVRGGIQKATDSGEGATMALPAGGYEARFQSSTDNPDTGRPDQYGWFPFDLTADTVWGEIMTTPVEIPVTPADVTLAQQAREDAQAAAAAAAISAAETDGASRLTRTKHDVARGLYFPEAEGGDPTGVNLSTAALTAAGNAAAAAGGTLYVDRSAVFRTDCINLTGSVRVTGGGTLRYEANSTAFGLLAVIGANDVLIEDVVFDGNLANQTTYHEGRAALFINGSSNVTVRNCTFKNLIGDGIYVTFNGSTPSSNINIYGNSFLGTNTNRNGVTLISCSGVQIHDNYFYRMARDDMPGAIDLEPNTTGDNISDVQIHHNIIVGGTATPVEQKAVVINNGVGANVIGVAISDNEISGAYRYGIAVFGNDVDKTKTQADVRGNTLKIPVSRASSAAIILSARVEATITDNTVDAATEFGIKTLGATFLISGNKIKNCLHYGLEIVGAANDSGTVRGNLIEDCGTNAVASHGGIHVKASRLDIVQNKALSSVSTKTQVGLYVESGVSNLIDGNTFFGMGVRSMSLTTAPQIIGDNTYSGGFNSVSGTYPPATETWVVGQMIRNPNPTAGGFMGWVCTTGGTPGTWKTFGAITA